MLSTLGVPEAELTVSPRRTSMTGAFRQDGSPSSSSASSSTSGDAAGKDGKPILGYVSGTTSRLSELQAILAPRYQIKHISFESDTAQSEAPGDGNIVALIVESDQARPGDISRLRELYPRRPIIVYLSRDLRAEDTTGALSGEVDAEFRHLTLESEPCIIVQSSTLDNLLLAAVQRATEYYRQVERNVELTKSLTKMNEDLEALLKSKNRDLVTAAAQEKAERRTAIIEQELDKARKIQSAVLPRAMPEVAHLRISTLYLPLDKIGGDFYGFVEFSNGDLGIYIADVSGHGIPAAFIASMVKLQFDQTAPFISSPAETLAHLNESLQDRTGGHFLTIFYGIIKKREHRIVYARAGHCSPFLHRKNSGEILELNSRGRMLGVFPELRSQDTETPFGPDDRLVLYTDGILESRDMRNPRAAGSEIFGEDRLRNTITNGKQENGYDFIDIIMADVEEFSGIPYFEDDVTLMVVDRNS